VEREDGLRCEQTIRLGSKQSRKATYHLP
jgi:hypothetical protein